MRNPVSRARLVRGLGAAAIAAGLAVAPATTAVAAPQAAAAAAYTPSAADFKDCPALPQGAAAWAWNCLAIVITGGEMKLGGLTQQVTKPITIPVAVGVQDWKVVLATPPGGFQSPPLDVPAGNLPLPLPGVTATVAQAGEVKPGKLVIPDELPIKIKVSSVLLSAGCAIGSEAAPIRLKPALSNLSLGTVGGVAVIKTKITDRTFAVPAATDCGLLTPVLNPLLGLPSAAGKNSADLDTVIRVKSYAFGETTTSFAGDNGIK
ncbi:hypothetical protein [Actinomadura parmotrematis]|uniref:Secreted protein n=1 Tax=Actinomadura parmotrematis TaxID=2864039 RepID=A0ABS7FM71_9ACTN|nr:hypothetical protein [Actinomadura parmotrematis]MBW8481475.1 hypothetical protein [Actinomadura parmotrematis]